MAVLVYSRVSFGLYITADIPIEMSCSMSHAFGLHRRVRKTRTMMGQTSPSLCHPSSAAVWSSLSQRWVSCSSERLARSVQHEALTVPVSKSTVTLVWRWTMWWNHRQKKGLFRCADTGFKLKLQSTRWSCLGRNGMMLPEVSVNCSSALRMGEAEFEINTKF